MELYKVKTLDTHLKYVFLYMRGELKRNDMSNFLYTYVLLLEPLLLVPPPPGENFCAELAFITKYVLYDKDLKANGAVRDYTLGLFQTLPETQNTLVAGRGHWLNPYVFLSSKGTFQFDKHNKLWLHTWGMQRQHIQL